jgi:hypothetical protein
MKKIITILSFIIFAINVKAQCPNGNAEQANFSYWHTQSGGYSTPINLMSSPAPAGRVDIIAPGTSDGMLIAGIDKYGNFPVPNEGNYAFRLGNNSTGAEADAMWYKFVVTPTNAHFKFRYAVVFNDFGHPANQQPSFSWFMNVSAYPAGHPAFVPHIANSSYYSSSYMNFIDRNLFNSTANGVTANSANPFFQISSVTASGGSKVLYKNWQCVEYDLTPYMGREVLIFFRSTDCSQGGHFGYAYIDGLCDALPATASFTLNKTQICDNGQALIMDGTASSGEDRYFIEIAESYDAAGTSLNTSNIVSGWTLGATAGIINLSTWYQAHGGVWKCGTYYKIKLAVSNDCAPWNEQNKMVLYYCPKVDAGPDQIVCCKSLSSTTIGVAPKPSIYYNWTSSPIGYSSTSSQNIVSPNTNTTYNLTITDLNGCKASDQVDVYVLGPLSVSINYNPLPDLDCSDNNCHSPNNNRKIPEKCTGSLNAITTISGCDGNPLSSDWLQKELGNLTYLWSTGETTSSIIPHSGISNYTVTVSNGCISATVSISGVVENGYYSQPIPTIGAPLGIKPYGTAAEQVCKFYEYGTSAPLLGTGPAYHAFRYRLRVYDRWGNLIRCIEDCRASGFTNGEIQWDAKDDAGNIVQQDVYTMQLTLWNCKSGVGISGFQVLRGRQWHCTHYHWVWGWSDLFPHQVCDAGYWEDVYDPSGFCEVTVVH